MPLRIRRQRRAESDELDIWLRIAVDNQRAADMLLDRFSNAVRMLADHPDAGRARQDLAEGLRSYPVEAYVIYYRHDTDVLRIVRILSSYRDLAPKMFR